MAIGKDIYAEITDKVIAQIEAGILPWVQPWQARNGVAFSGMPNNAQTKRAYSGINILLLWSEQAARGFGASSWLTFKQALDMGGNVRKGERGTMAVFANKFIPASEAKRAAETGETARAIPFLKKFTLFNVEQCESLKGIEAPAMPDLSMIEPNAQALIEATGARITLGGDKAFYMPSTDSICIPAPQSYFETINWHRTVFHELTHWTGAKHRLARDFSGRHGDTAYAREELVAEMGAAFVCGALGIAPTVRHADYIGSWLKVLKNDSKAIVQAASAASKAADYIRAFGQAVEEPERMAA